MKTRIEKSLAAFSMTVAMSSAAFAANVSTDGYVYLNADDPGGNYSFRTEGRWYENGSPASSAPTSGKNYLVQSTSGSMRVLRVDGSRIFQGSSLTLDNGEIRASGGNPFTVDSLIVYKGMMSAANASTQLKMAGGTWRLTGVGRSSAVIGLMRRETGHLSTTANTISSQERGTPQKSKSSGRRVSCRQTHGRGHCQIAILPRVASSDIRCAAGCFRSLVPANSDEAC